MFIGLQTGIRSVEVEDSLGREFKISRWSLCLQKCKLIHISPPYPCFRSDWHHVQKYLIPAESSPVNATGAQSGFDVEPNDRRRAENRVRGLTTKRERTTLRLRVTEEACVPPCLPLPDAAYLIPPSGAAHQKATVTTVLPTVCYSNAAYCSLNLNATVHPHRTDLHHVCTR